MFKRTLVFIALLSYFSISVDAYGQCVRIDNTTLDLTKTGTAPNETCNYSLTPTAIVVPPNGQRAKLVRLSFTMGGTTKYLCYTYDGANILVSESTASNCSGAGGGNVLPSTPPNYPDANFTFPCSASGGTATYSGYTNAAASSGGICTGGEIPIPITSGPFPVRIKTFKLDKEFDGVKVVWETEAELGSDKFLVQRSQDGRFYTTLTEVSAFENSTEVLKYEIKDSNPLYGTSYYRLKQIDLNGSFQFSKALAVEWKSEELVLFPNPAIDKEFVLNGITGDILASELIDSNGRVFPVTSLKEGNQAVNQFSQSLKPGIYTFRINTVNETISRKLILKE
ncbi:T9SS type A sorting domain-containing protein [Jiulongibacter sediminis]|uniref:T9SS type A sorting domain-containing protein n=1 Tax=Jiulongibacter sediminis TaxID=1605367 RepID=UPI0006DC85D6|nr:T9SS type A sorting domain-containing protein [Jiulongibacter sediminis]